MDVTPSVSSSKASPQMSLLFFLTNKTLLCLSSPAVPTLCHRGLVPPSGHIITHTLQPCLPRELLERSLLHLLSLLHDCSKELLHCCYRHNYYQSGYSCSYDFYYCSTDTNTSVTTTVLMPPLQIALVLQLIQLILLFFLLLLQLVLYCHHYFTPSH